MAYLPRNPITITGADLSGSTGNINRTYTLELNSVDNGMLIIIEGAPLQINIDFTFDENTNIITFINPIWDDQNITINYFIIKTGGIIVDGFYTSPVEIARASGIGVEVYGENLGTGDNITDSYDISNGNVLQESYNLYYGDSESNDVINLVETTHYTLNKDRGTILLTSVGISLINNKVLYIDYMYSPKQSNSTLYSYLGKINSEVDKTTYNYWGNPKSSTKYYDGFNPGYPGGDEPYSSVGEDNKYEIDLGYKGINSISSIDFLDLSGDSNTTLNSTQYRFFNDDENDGRLIINQTVPNGQGNIKVMFIHGYDEVPDLIQELASLIGGMMALVNISGGSYKDVSTYSLGRKSFSIGQVYVNIESSIKQMRLRIEQISNMLGGNFGCA